MQVGNYTGVPGRAMGITEPESLGWPQVPQKPQITLPEDSRLSAAGCGGPAPGIALCEDLDLLVVVTLLGQTLMASGTGVFFVPRGR